MIEIAQPGLLQGRSNRDHPSIRRDLHLPPHRDNGLSVYQLLPVQPSNGHLRGGNDRDTGVATRVCGVVVGLATGEQHHQEQTDGHEPGDNEWGDQQQHPHNTSNQLLLRDLGRSSNERGDHSQPRVGFGAGRRFGVGAPGG